MLPCDDARFDDMFRRSFSPSQWFDSEEPPAPDWSASEAMIASSGSASRGAPVGGGKIMWVYRKLTDPWAVANDSGKLWAVGFYDPQKEWHEEARYETAKEAAARVHWLNGGQN